MYYISLNDLICYIDSYSSAFFDPNAYKFYFENELSSDDTSEMLKVPKVEERTIVDKFIKQCCIMHSKKTNDEKNISLDKFHKEINNRGIYDEWIQFRRNVLSNVAVDWCLTNNIKFTNKDSPRN